MPRKFVDTLGAVRYFDVLKAELPPGMPVGILIGFFDKKTLTAWDVIEWCLANGHDVRVHGVWNATHKYTEKNVQQAVARAKRLNALKLAYPQRTILYSPFLEWKAIAGGAKKAFAKVRDAAPDLRLVSCGDNIPNTIHETHYHGGGKIPKGDIASTDGVSHADVAEEYDAAAKNCLWMGSWEWHSNGRTEGGPALPVNKRKNWTTPKQFREQLKLLGA